MCVFFFLVLLVLGRGGGEGEVRKGMLVLGSFLTTRGEEEEEEDKGGPTRREIVMTSVPNRDSRMICSGVMCSFRQVVLLRVGEGKRGGRCHDKVEERRDRRSGEGGVEGVEVLLFVPVLVLVLFCGFFMRMRESGEGFGALSGAAAWTKGEGCRRRRRRRREERRRKE